MQNRPRATARKLLAVGFSGAFGKVDRPEDTRVRRHMMWASATLALSIAGVAAVAACGGSPANGSASNASNTCVNPTAAHRAYVVVMHASAKVVQKCVGFNGDTIDGQSLMDESKIEYQAQDFGPSLGKAVCQLDNEPAHYTKCFPDNGPYWSTFVETNGQWTLAQTGYSQVTLHDREALGWVYTASESPSPPPPAKE